MADEIKIDLVLDGKDAVKGLKDVEDQAKKSGKRAGSKFGGAFKLAASGALVATAAVAAAALAGKQFVDAAIVQDEAVQKLNASLRNMGVFTKETSNSLQAFAADIEKTTTVGDEAVLQQLSFAQAMGATVDQSKEFVRAAIQLSAATGKDLDSSMLQISKTLSGLKGELGESVPAVRALTEEQLKAGEAAKVILREFKGFEEAAASTFQGRLIQLGNSFGSLTEKIGDIVLKTPAFTNAFLLLRKGIDALVNNFNVDAISGFIQKTINSYISFQQAAMTYLWKPLEVTYNVFKAVFEGIYNHFVLPVITKINDIFSSIANNPWIQKLTGNALAGFSLIGEGLSTFGSQAKGLLDQYGLLDTSFTDSMIQKAGNLKEILNEKTETFVEDQRKVVKAVEQTGTKVKEIAFDISQNLNAALGKGAQLAIGSLVNSLMTGENGFKDFTKSILGLLGDLATQIGTTLLLAGTGISALFNLSGPAALAAGAGLIALGQVLKSFSGGGGASVAPTSPTGDVAATPTVGGPIEATEIAEEESREKQQQVQLVVHGDVLDSQETGTKLIRLLNENFESSGSKLITA